MATHQVRTMIRGCGERLTMVTRDRQIVSLAAIYIATQPRRRAQSFNTIRGMAIAIAALLSFCEEQGIEMFPRVVRGRFLLDQEWLGFLSVLSRKGGMATVARRAKDAVRFLAFWARWWAGTIADDEAYDSYVARAATRLDAMREEIPSAGNPSSDRDEVPPQTVKILVRVLTSEADLAKLWSNPWVRVRNALLLWWHLLLGNRVGEAMSIQLSDLELDGRRPTAAIVRRQDNPKDPRRLQPSVKGKSRRISLPSELLPHLADWLAIRSQAHPTTDFLFVAKQGKPLSASSVAKVYDRLGKLYSELSGYSPHSYRHTYIATARRVRDRDGDPQVDAAHSLARQVGWEDEGSNVLYGHAQRAEAADALMLRVQEKLLDPALPSSPAAACANATRHPSEGRLGGGDERVRSRRDGPDRSR